MFLASLPQWVFHLANYASPRIGDVLSASEDGSYGIVFDKGDYRGACEAVSTTNSCCEALAKQLPSRVAYPETCEYSQSINSYWSLRETIIHPSCVVLPESADEVSKIVQTLAAGMEKWNEQCQFAIRGGGHTPFAGAANIEQGIVVHLKHMPSPGLASDHRTITVSPSVTWDEVFGALDAFNLATLGGRVGGVGVGGLATGCGISYFSPRYGFTCDMVEDFEVVLASGDIVHANATSHRSLWKALRGGSNNYGIVTSITLRTFPQGDFWGGQTFHPIETRQSHFKALENLIAAYPYDEYVHFINTLVITNATRSWFIGNSLQYTKSEPPVPFPETFKPFTDIPRMSLFPGAPDNTLRVDNHTAFTLEYAAMSVYQKSWQFATISFGNSATMMEEFFQLTNNTIQPFLGLPGFQLSLAYQPLPTIMTERRGAVDSLGPIQTEGNMFFVHWAMAVDDVTAHDDMDFQKVVKTLFQKAEEKAASMGLQRDYLPLTYADVWQDPIGRRSKHTVKNMWKTSQRYDPNGMFQSQVPGGFKLPNRSLI